MQNMRRNEIIYEGYKRNYIGKEIFFGKIIDSCDDDKSGIC